LHRDPESGMDRGFGAKDDVTPAGLRFHGRSLLVEFTRGRKAPCRPFRRSSMKTRILRALAIVSWLLTASETWARRDPNGVPVDRTIGAPFPHRALVQFFIKQVDPRTYDIRAIGTADPTDQQYLDAWVRMADDLAAGRPCEKQTTIEPERHESEGGSG
jgi:hypothetical protein